MKEWFQGTECNTRSGEDILSSMEAMAKLHTVMQAEQDEDMPGADLLEECRRHNRGTFAEPENLYRKRRRKTRLKSGWRRASLLFWKQGREW